MKKSDFKTALFISLRYLFSKKRHNIINIISIISTVGIMVSTAALIIVLSVFNGMEELVTNSFNSFNPDMKITLKEGKSFPADSFPVQKIQNLPGVQSVQEIVSDMVLLTYNDKQMLLSLKGVEDDYAAVSGIDSLMIDGDFKLRQGNSDFGVIGGIAAGTMQLNLNNNYMLKLYYPKRTRKNLGNPADAFNTQFLIPAAVFATNTQYDEQFLFSSIDFARLLMDYEGEVTSLEIKLKKGENLDKWRKEIEGIAGDKYDVKDRYQQEELLFKTMKSEKLIIFVILAFILILAAFNIIGTLGMLIIEKKEDISVLNSFGAKPSLIRKIFLMEGMSISLLGGILGIVLGFLVCFIQQTFHVVGLGGADSHYIIDYYPVSMALSDFAITLVTILLISFITSWFPVKKMARLNYNIKERK